jgi:ABC-2 type transport system permease protein
MFSRAVFWQSVRSHWVLWVICTVVLTAMLSLMIAFHDPSRLSAFMDIIEDTPIAAEAGDQLDLFGTLLGMLTQTIYGFAGLMIAMVYVVVTANGLVASEVDRGSMAYTLSTPIKRTTVIFTKAVYLVLSIVLMVLIMGGAGAVTTQAKHHALWGTRYTDDVKAAAKVLDLDNAQVAGDLSLIVNAPEAFVAGARARGVGSDVYAAYLIQAMQRDAYAAAAEALGVSVSQVEEDLSLVRENVAALEAAAAVMGMAPAALDAYLEQAVAQADASEAQQAVIQEQLAKGLSAAAENLGITTAELAADLNLLRSSSQAKAVASEASGLDAATLDQVLIQAMAAGEVNADIGVDFDRSAYLVMNLGFLLLMLAVSGISFLASCIFNLSKFSMALGAGLPFAFLILNLLSTVNDTLEPLRYFSLMTLFDTQLIMEGGTYWPQFVVLVAFAAILYALGTGMFKRRDLPL